MKPSRVAEFAKRDHAAAADLPTPRLGEELLVLSPLRIEAMAVRSGAPRATVLRSGMGPLRAQQAARQARKLSASLVAVAGCCGALDESLAPGEVVVATEVRGPHGSTSCFAAAELVAALRALGITAREGLIVSVDHIVRGAERARLAEGGAIAVDMESAWLAEGANGRPLVVLRTVLDTPTREILNPVATTVGAMRAYRALVRASRALADWADSLSGSRAPPDVGNS